MNIFLWVIVSILIILILHYLYDFFKETLSNPITKDLIKKPNETIDDVARILKEKNEEIKLQNETETSMKNELKSFFKELNSNNNDTNLESNSNLSYSQI